MNTQTYTEIAKNIVLQTQTEILNAFQNNIRVNIKSDHTPVTITDRNVEKMIRKKIKQHFPNHHIFGEEFENTTDPKNPPQYLWIIDPIDGTRSFIAGNPLFGTLLALVHNEKPIIGIINMPALNQCFHAHTKTNAMCNDKIIHVKKNNTHNTILINEFPRVIKQSNKIHNNIITLFENGDKGKGPTIRTAHDCYAYAQLAAGYVDGVIDCGLKIVDFIPLIPIIKAAGGIISDWNGKPLNLNSDGNIIAAANQNIYDTILNALN